MANLLVCYTIMASTSKEVLGLYLVSLDSRLRKTLVLTWVLPQELSDGLMKSFSNFKAT